MTVSTARRALETLLAALAEAVRPATVGLGASPGPASGVTSTDAPGTEVMVIPTGLRRVGRSRRGGALLDLELTVTVVTSGPDALDHLERVLILAETNGITVGAPPEPPVLGLTLSLPVSVTLPEPTGPRVTTPVVELHPLRVLAGSVLTADGHGAAGVAVSSRLTGQVVHTDPAGRFQLVGTGLPTTVTATSGPLSASVEVAADAATIEIELPSPPEGS